MEYGRIHSDLKQGKIAPIYLFFGEEPYLIDHLTRAVLDYAIDPTTRDFNCDVLTGEDADGQSVVDLASAYPMMADRRVVVLKSVQKFSPSDKKRIQAYVENPLESTCLVLTAGKIDRRQKFYAALVKHAVWMESKPLYPSQAVDWVRDQMRQRKVSIDAKAAEFLVQQTGTSLWALHNEMEKVETYAVGKSRIDPEDVSAVAGFSRKYNVWELTDAVGKRDLSHAISILKQMMEEGHSVPGILIELTRRVFLLIRVRSLMDRGLPQSAIQSQLNLKPYFMRLYLEQARRFTQVELIEAASLLLRTDLSIKTGMMKPELAVVLAVHGLAHKHIKR